MSSEMREYADRDHMELDRDGNYYCRHVSAMTREGLHAKSDIAAELAWRDREIDRLRALLARTEAGADGAVAWIRPDGVTTSDDGLARHWASQGLQHRPLVYGDTRPKYASGDAEFSAAELESLAKCVLASVTPGGFHIPEGWNCLLDKLAAMQAKEAK